MLFESEYLWMVADGLCRDDSSIASLPADLQAELAKIIVVVASNDARRDRGTQNLVAFVEPTASKLSGKALLFSPLSNNDNKSRCTYVTTTWPFVALVAAPEFVAMAQDAGVMAQVRLETLNLYVSCPLCAAVLLQLTSFCVLRLSPFCRSSSNCRGCEALCGVRSPHPQLLSDSIWDPYYLRRFTSWACTESTPRFGLEDEVVLGNFKRAGEVSNSMKFPSRLR